MITHKHSPNFKDENQEKPCSTMNMVDLALSTLVQASPSGCSWLEIPAVSQVEQGEHRRWYVHESCEVRWCCTAAAVCCCCIATGYCTARMRLKLGARLKRAELESSLVVFRMMARPHTHTHTGRSTGRSCHKTKILKYGYYCCTMTATTSYA